MKDQWRRRPADGLLAEELATLVEVAAGVVQRRILRRQSRVYNTPIVTIAHIVDSLEPERNLEQKVIEAGLG